MVNAKTMLKNQFLAVLSVLSTLGLSAQVQTATYRSEPVTFSETTEVTVIVSGVDLSAWGVNDAYLWTWYQTSTGGGDSPTNGTWNNSNEAQKMTKLENGDLSFTFKPTELYGVTGINRIGVLVKAKNGKPANVDKKTQDHLFDVGGFQLVLTTPSSSLTVLDSPGESLAISAEVSTSAILTLKVGDEVVETLQNVRSYQNTVTVNETTKYTLIAESGQEKDSVQFTAAIRPDVIQAAMPSKLLDGMNLHVDDKTKATLVFYAPQKQFVHVIGDFNQWSIDDQYVMKYDPVADRFWLTLEGLTPGANHLYQYLVEFSINVADPYSTLVLDGYGNDRFIDAVTYPDLPAYPEGQTHALTVLNTDEPKYTWQVTDFVKPKRDDLVIYELLIRDFDSRHSFDAVVDRLDYLENLGVNAIELMPVNEFDGNESWGYNPAFHMALDKYYGTKNAFKHLIDEAHKRGIAVLIDVVYNHASGQHPYFRMYNTSGGNTDGVPLSTSPFFNETPKHAYNVFNDFNHQRQGVIDYVNRTVAYWIEEFKIDGMRWDLTKGFTQNCSESDEGCTGSLQQDRVEVLKGYADTQWAIDPDFYVIFEHLGGIAEESLWANYRREEGKGIMLWNNLNGPAAETTMGYVNSSNLSNASWRSKGFSWPAAISYMESHDEERLMYKNIQFGNETETYSTKDLSVALQRLEAAGIVFYSVPGPKMLWQFGELGYDVGINENGRTGNKPIRWNYFSQSARKAVYDTWSKVFKLKTEEPIFEMNDFATILGGSTGIKSVVLRDNEAEEGAISEVVVIGNFSLSPVTVSNVFSKVGTWHNLLDFNRIFEVSATTQTLTLAPGQAVIYADAPSKALIAPNDSDGDGVLDTDDNCPETPLGATVNSSGCIEFSLPIDFFSVNASNETCLDKVDGVISVSAKEIGHYKLSISSSKLNMVETFSASFKLENLAAGTYELCISVVDVEDYQRCYTIEIGQPDPLSVSSFYNSQKGVINLSMRGADRYLITLNGRKIITDKSSIELPISGTSYQLNVFTDRICQGVFEEFAVVDGGIVLYPNPSYDLLHIQLNNPQQLKTIVEVYNLSGALELKQIINEKAPVISLDVGNLPTGLHLIKLIVGSSVYLEKFVKR